MWKLHPVKFSMLFHLGRSIGNATGLVHWWPDVGEIKIAKDRWCMHFLFFSFAQLDIAAGNTMWS